MVLLPQKRREGRSNTNVEVVAVPPKMSLENVVEFPEKKFVLAVLVNTPKNVAKFNL